MHPTQPHAVNVNTVGWILVLVGLIALLADILMMERWGPRYFRRAYAEQPPAPGYGGYPRRRVIEEDETAR